MTGIFFGSMTGTTESAANEIAARLGVAADDVHNVADVSADEAERYDLLLLGSSTWGCGELQDDWYGFLDALKSKDLTGRKVGLFGCGDSGSYPDTFCDAIGIIYDALQSAGCSFVGALAPEDYLALGSRACRDGRLLGLVIDENAPASNAGRMDTWCRLIETE
ncbi:MAG TPA: flavodoxin [Candidatus Alistipes excrementipullorum]|nr:flavodoxin [Candidatus Alistipes excrementipullorum]